MSDKKSPDRPKRDRWDKIQILLGPAASLFTALTVTAISLIGQNIIEKGREKEKEIALAAQKEETIRNETVQNYRLYTELLSRREDAESELRRNMFSTILEKFFQVGSSGAEQSDMDERLLKLEMLALNFGESLSLSPLFIATDHLIDRFPYPSSVADIARARDRNRLHSLARRVADQQLSALFAGSASRDITIPLYSLIDFEGNPLRDENFNEKDYVYPDDDENYRNLEEDGIFQMELEGIKRTYVFTFSDFNKKYKSVHVDIEIVEEKGEGDMRSIESVDRGFELNYFNFPMVDNTRLSKDQRLAIVLRDFGETQLKVTAIIFPGKYSGQRDKPFLDDVIHRLQKSSVDKELAGEEADSPIEEADSIGEKEEIE